MNIQKEFSVVKGQGAFEIIDRTGGVFAREPDEDRADLYCERLNGKWEAMMKEFLYIARKEPRS